MRRIALLSLFTAIALILSLVDSALPPLLPVPGVRLGLANVVTLILLFAVRVPRCFSCLDPANHSGQCLCRSRHVFPLQLGRRVTVLSRDLPARSSAPPFLCNSSQHVRSACA